jgi:hypothetical protein
MPNAPRLTHHIFEKYRKLYTTIWSALPNIPEIKKIIMALELDPVDLNWRLWTDYQGHLLYYSAKKQTIKIKNINQKLRYRDIYHKAPIKKIFENTIYLVFTIKNDTITTWCLGNDKKIRALIFQNNQWLRPNIPPLSLDFFPLILIFRYLYHYKSYHLYKKSYHVSPYPFIDDNLPIQLLNNAIIKGST